MWVAISVLKCLTKHINFIKYNWFSSKMNPESLGKQLAHPKVM